MFESSFLIQHLTDADMTRLTERMVEQQFLADEIIIQEGRAPGRLYFVLNGLVSVYIQSAAGQRRELVRLGPGELIGDLAWLERSEASASVRAAESSLLASLDIAQLERLMADDAAFARRFMRAMATLNASRLRRLTEQLRAHHADAGWLAEQAASQELVRQTADFKALALRADREAIGAKGAVPARTAAEVRAAFVALVHRLNEFMSSEAVPPGLKQESAAFVQREFLPFLLLTSTAEPMYSKPRGYAGDCDTIAMIYANRPAGTGRVGALLDECFLECGAAKAVRNRRALLADEIMATIRAGSPARVTSLACGPAAEIFDVFTRLETKSSLELVAIDIDRKALEMVKRRADDEGLAAQVQTYQGNLVYLATGRQALDIAPQALMYSIGLIDYFRDDFVVKLLDWIYDRLAPGGRVILGNFHPRNPIRALMDHVLEWSLIHRTEEDMNRLFERSKFGRPCSRILYEPERINLFAEGIRPG